MILHLDHERGDYHGEATNHLNPKLAKLMGVANSSVAQGDDMSIVYEDDSGSEDDFDEDDSMIDRVDEVDEESQMTQTATETLSDETHPSDQKKLLPLASGHEMDFMLSSLNSKKKLAVSGPSSKKKGPETIKKKSNTLTLTVEDLEAGGITKTTKGSKPKVNHSKSNSGSVGHRKQKSNLLEVGRYRSKRQLNFAAKNDWELDLKSEMLPNGIKHSQIKDKWSVKEGFEVIKHILAEHEGLWDHVKDFHIENLQKSVKLERYVWFGLVWLVV